MSEPATPPREETPDDANPAPPSVPPTDLPEDVGNRGERDAVAEEAIDREDKH